MDPLDPLKKLADQVEVEDRKGDREIVISVPRSFLFYWLAALTFGGIAIALLGGWQLASLIRVVQSIDEKLTSVLEWRGAADMSIRYNTNRIDEIDKEHAAEGEGHHHFVVPPKSCSEARPGEPCLLR